LYLPSRAQGESAYYRALSSGSATGDGQTLIAKKGQGIMRTVQKKRFLILNIDPFIIMMVLVLATISIVAISSATYTDDPTYVNKQIVWYVVGFLCMSIFLLLDYKILSQGRFLYILFGFSVLLNLLVMVPGLGVEVNGAQLWFRIGGFQFQPSEMMKLILILILAKVLAEKKGHPWSDLSSLGRICLLFGVPFLIILAQPDLGTALILFGILLSMLLVSGLDWKWFVSGLLVIGSIAGSVLLLYVTDSPLLHVILQPHQVKRIQIFIDPASDPSGAGYQSTQAKIAIGSGMLHGKGFHQGTQAQGNWIPEPHNDFIFAVYAEEFGFIGASILICAYLLLIYRMLVVALRSDHLFGTYIVAGVMGMFVFQIYQNIGMTIGLMPITGIPLPLISYGGSSLLTQMLAIGFVVNVGMRTQTDALSF
jgi:rod shape determining protein RodA